MHRRSKTHRTDVPGGCLFVTPQGATSGTIDYTYLDALPFPIADVARHRHRLCDYCFFGGPHKSQLFRHEMAHAGGEGPGNGLLEGEPDPFSAVANLCIPVEKGR